MKNIILTSPAWHEPVKKKTLWIFLAGPAQGAPEWQSEVISKFPELGVTLCNPRRDEMGDGPKYYAEQLIWETEHLNAADIIMFWFPPESTHVPGRDYGQTTRAELSEWLEKSRASSKPVVVGIDPGIPGARYFKEKAFEYGIPVYDTLEETLSVVVEKAKSALGFSKTWYTSDTHFGSSRALELSRRPFRNTLDMDRTLIRNWNSKVRPQDYVIHLGDFGEPGVLKYLNGNIRLVLGNYEEDRAIQGALEDRGVEILGKTIYGYTKKIQIGMSHKPSDSKGLLDLLRTGGPQMSIFGHTHGRQTIKDWPGLDVGTDAHHFFPISEDDIDLWYTAITKYYDRENYL